MATENAATADVLNLSLTSSGLATTDTGAIRGKYLFSGCHLQKIVLEQSTILSKGDQYKRKKTNKCDEVHGRLSICCVLGG